jgi:hypothetical protein
MQDFSDEVEETRTQEGLKWLGRVLAILIILAVALFGDVMYIQLMSSKFPTGPLLTLCYIGAFTSFLAVVYMLIGKSILFTPGKQMVLAWLVFIVELALIALNIILVFQSDGTNSTGFLAAWLQIAPATPVINMAGVAILFFLDEDRTMHHEDMEQAIKLKRANRRHVKAMANARLRVQAKHLSYLESGLERAINSPESLGLIQQAANEMNAQLLSSLAGRSYAPTSQIAGPTGPVVAADPEPPTPPVSPVPQKKRFLDTAKEKIVNLFGDGEPQPAALAQVAPIRRVTRSIQPPLSSVAEQRKAARQKKLARPLVSAPTNGANRN